MKYLIKAHKVLQGANKRFWKLWIPLTVVGLLAVYMAFSLLETVVAKRLDHDIHSAARLFQSQYTQRLRSAKDDLAFITLSAQVGRFLQHQSPEHWTELNRFFHSIVSTYQRYDQVRLLSPEGLELSRVNFNGGVPQIVPLSELQDKSQRYYFKEAVLRTERDIYISRMDLNVEQGEVELPYKPVIRLAKAIRGRNGDVIGVVVLNYMANSVLEGFRNTVKNLPGERMLLDAHGFWLSNDERSKEWGFMWEQGENIAELHPALWLKLSGSNSGVIETPLGRINYHTLSPPEGLDQGGLGTWKLVVINNNHKLGVSFLNEHLTYLYPLLLAYLFSTVILWLWARADSGRELAEQELIAMNRLLERRVDKRTAELEATKDAAILSLATLAETRDNETGQHIFRTQQYVRILAEEVKTHPAFAQQLTESMIQRIYKSAPLHDIGKVGVPDHILLKPGRLNADEREIMQQHSKLGSDAIEQAINAISIRITDSDSASHLHCARDIAHYHHERWDGKGYPKGLVGEAIPLSARLMAIADVYDALVTERPYKKAFSKVETEHIMLQMSQGQFDPRILEGFDRVKDQFWQISQQFSD